MRWRDRGRDRRSIWPPATNLAIRADPGMGSIPARQWLASCPGHGTGKRSAATEEASGQACARLVRQPDRETEDLAQPTAPLSGVAVRAALHRSRPAERGQSALAALLYASHVG